MEDKLYKYQLPHFYQLEANFKEKDCLLDASDTGTGKTYVAVALSYVMGKKPFIICPRSVILSWISVTKALGVEIFGIANYELIKGGKYYTVKMEKVDCPYLEKIKVVDPNDKNEDAMNRKMIVDFKFSLPDDVMIIIDEAHRCKNHKTMSSRLMLALFRAGRKTLLLSATISDKIDCFKPFGVVFGFYTDITQFKMWIRRQKKSRVVYYKDKNLNEEQITLDIIHSHLFPYNGSRMKIKDLGTMFPSNQVLSQAYMSANKEEIQKQYDIIEDAFRDLRDKETRSEGLGKLIRARMKIEMLKVPIMLDIIEEAVDSNYSVAVFVNYKDTMNYLAHYFETDCLIHGDQTMEERQSCIDDFQSNRSKIIICIIQAGGVGISLHDIHGGHPRMSVISPTWSGQDTQQVLGRIHRAGSKSPALQRIVFVAGTYEEDICYLIQKKLTNISGINDRDLLGPKFTEELYEEVEDSLDNINKGVVNGKEIDSNEKVDPMNGEDEDNDDNDLVDSSVKTMVRKKSNKIEAINSDNDDDKENIKKVVKKKSDVKKYSRIVGKNEKRKYVKKDKQENN